MPTLSEYRRKQKEANENVDYGTKRIEVRKKTYEGVMQAPRTSEEYNKFRREINSNNDDEDEDESYIRMEMTLGPQDRMLESSQQSRKQRFYNIQATPIFTYEWMNLYIVVTRSLTEMARIFGTVFRASTGPAQWLWKWSRTRRGGVNRVWHLDDLFENEKKNSNNTNKNDVNRNQPYEDLDMIYEGYKIVGLDLITPIIRLRFKGEKEKNAWIKLFRFIHYFNNLMTHRYAEKFHCKYIQTRRIVSFDNDARGHIRTLQSEEILKADEDSTYMFIPQVYFITNGFNRMQFYVDKELMMLNTMTDKVEGLGKNGNSQNRTIHKSSSKKNKNNMDDDDEEEEEDDEEEKENDDNEEDENKGNNGDNSNKKSKGKNKKDASSIEFIPIMKRLAITSEVEDEFFNHMLGIHSYTNSSSNNSFQEFSMMNINNGNDIPSSIEPKTTTQRKQPQQQKNSLERYDFASSHWFDDYGELNLSYEMPIEKERILWIVKPFEVAFDPSTSIYSMKGIFIPNDVSLPLWWKDQLTIWAPITKSQYTVPLLQFQGKVYVPQILHEEKGKLFVEYKEANLKHLNPVSDRPQEQQEEMNTCLNDLNGQPHFQYYMYGNYKPICSNGMLYFLSQENTYKPIPLIPEFCDELSLIPQNRNQEDSIWNKDFYRNAAQDPTNPEYSSVETSSELIYNPYNNKKVKVRVRYLSVPGYQEEILPLKRDMINYRKKICKDNYQMERIQTSLFRLFSFMKQNKFNIQMLRSEELECFRINHWMFEYRNRELNRNLPPPNQPSVTNQRNLPPNNNPFPFISSPSFRSSNIIQRELSFPFIESPRLNSPLFKS